MPTVVQLMVGSFMIPNLLDLFFGSDALERENVCQIFTKRDIEALEVLLP